MSTWQEFTAIPNGTRVFNYAFDQCVALANLYHESVIGGSFVPVPSAYMWWTDFWSYPTLINNYTPSPTPVAGAIFLARYGLYDAPNGHIGVVTQVYGDGTFDTMEQNAGTWRYVGRYRRGMANMLGFLVPKNNPAIPAGKPVAPSIPETEEAQPMGNIFVWKKEKGKQINAIFNTESGFFHPFESANGVYNSNIAKTFGVVTPTAGISTSHFAAIQRDIDNVRRGK